MSYPKVTVYTVEDLKKRGYDDIYCDCGHQRVVMLGYKNSFSFHCKPCRKTLKSYRLVDKTR